MAADDAVGSIVLSGPELVTLMEMFGSGSPALALDEAHPEGLGADAVRAGLLAREVLVFDDDGEPLPSEALRPLLGITMLAERSVTVTRLDHDGRTVVHLLWNDSADVLHDVPAPGLHRLRMLDAQVEDDLLDIAARDVTDPAQAGTVEVSVEDYERARGGAPLDGSDVLARFAADAVRPRAVVTIEAAAGDAPALDEHHPRPSSSLHIGADGAWWVDLDDDAGVARIAAVGPDDARDRVVQRLAAEGA